MEETNLAIPFDVNSTNEKFLKRLLSKFSRLLHKVVIRMSDIVLSFLGLIILVPITIFIKLYYISKHDNKSIFKTSECIGKNGKRFKVIKYRTTNADGKSNRLKQTGWCNLPELINVFCGDMTFVGPKPYSIKDEKKMGTYYGRIIQMKPGITGVSQISMTKKSFEQRLDVDIRYFYQRNFWINIKIMVITMLIVMPRKNKGQLLSFLNFTAKDVGRTIIKYINLSIKRVFDIIGGVVGIILLIPLTLVVAIINFSSGDFGPIFFTQERIGKNGKKFKMFKYRSMVMNADEKLKELLENNEELRKEYSKYKKLKDDPRITKAGKFLRKTSLDEFPQLLNVLIGDMSLVGPRPYLEREKKDMDKYYTKIVEHKPGITGLWQITGRSNVTFNQRLDIDMEYHKDNNIFFDIEILFKTFFKVLNRDNAI